MWYTKAQQSAKLIAQNLTQFLAQQVRKLRAASAAMLAQSNSGALTMQGLLSTQNWRDYSADALRLLQFLTRVPLPALDYKPLSQLYHALPLAALLLALLQSVIALLLIGLLALVHDTSAANPLTGQAVFVLLCLLFAGIQLLLEILITGGLHEDGLADYADALWGGHSPERRLEILKDSRVGSYGVLALLLSGLLRWVLLALLFALVPSFWQLLVVMIATVLLSRIAFMAVMWDNVPARSQGLAQQSAALNTASLIVPYGLSLVLLALFMVFILGLFSALLSIGLLAIALTGLVALLRYNAQQAFGGTTGDLFGATQQLAALLVLLILVLGLA